MKVVPKKLIPLRLILWTVFTNQVVEEKFAVLQSIVHCLFCSSGSLFLFSRWKGAEHASNTRRFLWETQPLLDAY